MAIPLLFVHRSIVSHSFLLPLLLLGVVEAGNRLRPEGPITRLTHAHADPRLRLFTLGLCAALAVHFCLDLFPRSWSGYSLIHVPVLGRLPWLLSSCWLLASAIGCLYFGCRMLRTMFDLLLAVGCTGAAFGLAAAREPRCALYALLILLVIAPLTFILPRPRAARNS